MYLEKSGYGSINIVGTMILYGSGKKTASRVNFCKNI